MSASPPESVLWQPHPGPQTRALASSAFELCYGGQAGGGKSAWLLASPLRWIDRPEFRAIIFRRTFPELKKGLAEKAWDIYPALGATHADYTWTFPSGAKLWLSNLEHEHDVQKHKGPEYQFIGFDELDSFLLSQYRYMISRLRSAAGIPIRLRATVNPDPGWVRDRFAPWVRTSEEYTGPRVADGTVLHYEFDEATETEVIVPRRTALSTSRQFIRARLEDNPTLTLNDPQYAQRLNLLDPVQRRRLKDGDWEAEYGSGVLFQQAWFPMATAAPLGIQRARFWDRAATEVKFSTKASMQPKAVNDPDWTAGVMMGREKSGRSWVEDVARMRGKPFDVEQIIKRTAEADELKYGRHGFAILLEQEPGASGVAEIATYLKLLARWHVVAVPAFRDKIRRAGAVSAQSQAGNITVLRGEWNGAFFRELEAFPTGKHDDQVDGFSGAYNFLTGAPSSEGASVQGRRRSADMGGF